MRKILELLFCLVALIALLVFTQNIDDVKNVETEEALVAISAEGQNSAADNVAMLENQK